MNASALAPGRIDYIDAIKGFSILWVVVIHFGPIIPEWMLAPYRMPLFFFMSGILFRVRPAREFFSRRINTLIIPFVCWFILSWLFLLIKYEFLGQLVDIPRETSGGVWEMGLKILHLFKLYDTQSHYPLEVNGALWFLIALFYVQTIYYGIRKITSHIGWIVALGAVCYAAGLLLEQLWHIGFMFIPYSMTFLIYYIVGSLVGSKLIDRSASPRAEGYGFAVCSILLVLFWWLDHIVTNEHNLIYKQISINCRIFAFIGVVFILFRHIGSLRVLEPLRFFGRNSLVLLCTHLLLFNITETVAFRFLNIFGTREELKQSIGYHLLLFLIVCIASYFAIKLCNKYIPWTVGKREVFSIHKTI